MLNELFRKAMYHPFASLICMLLAVLLDCVSRTLGLTLMTLPFVGLLTVLGIISLLLVFYQVDTRKKVLASVSCVVLLLLFMVEMMDVLTTFDGSGTVEDTAYDPGYSDEGIYHGRDENDYEYDRYEDDDYEDHDHGSRHEDECAVCHGTSQCTACNGRGGSICTNCRSGRCKYCHGSGTSSGYGVSTRCGACNGTGDCTLCDGHGKRECGICYGNGRCKYCD